MQSTPLFATWRGGIIIFATGFILAALVFSITPSIAQNAKTLPSGNATYVAQATKNLNLLQKFYATNNGFLNESSTLSNVVAITNDLSTLTKEMSSQKPPTELLAYHTQFLFAAQRCENLSFAAQGYKTSKGISEAGIVPLIIYKENCASQIQAARLRLIDFAASDSVDVSEATLMPTAINTKTIETTSAPPGTADDLGIPYEYIEVDPGIEVSGWETYEDHNGYWSVSGNILNKNTTDRFSSVTFKVRFYKGQRVVKIEGISAGGRWVAPGQSLPFEFEASVKPAEFDRYTIEVTVGDWGKTP